MKRHLFVVLLVVLVGISAFFAGKTLAASSPAGGQRTGDAMGQNGARFAGGAGGTAGVRAGAAGMRGGMVAGTILSIDKDHVTVSLPDGGSKMAFISATTPVVTITSSTMADVTVGTKVRIIGSAGQDGNVTAQSIQIGNVDMFPRGGAGGFPGGQPTGEQQTK